MAAGLSKPERETLKAIWRISAGPGTPGVARTGDLAASLGVSPGTVTATVKRLDELGMASHEPYRGVELTAEGSRQAMAVIRRHRIVERFLADVLGYDWTAADRLAPTFEHQLPQEVEDRLYRVLGQPATCPHGFPIPGEQTDSLPTLPELYDLPPGVPAVVALPGSTDAEVAAFLDGLGLRPGAEVEVVERHPFDGPLVVSVGGTQRVLGEKLARRVLVTPTERSAASGSGAVDNKHAADNNAAAENTARGLAAPAAENTARGLAAPAAEDMARGSGAPAAEDMARGSGAPAAENRETAQT